jgi:hypothetical protein
VGDERNASAAAGKGRFAMAQETKVEETRCSLQTFERNRYFHGKPLSVSDFETEQRYLIGKHRYINRLVHGAGVLCGLQVKLPVGFSADRPTVELAEGAALDCCGNLIIVSRSVTAEVKGDFDPSAKNYLFIKYSECSKQPVMLAANGSSCEETCCYNRIQETYEIVASRTPPGGGAESGGGKGGQATAMTSARAETAPPETTTVGETVPNAEAVCRGLTEQYFQKHLRTCPGCDDPLVFLAVLDTAKGAIDDAETAKYRSVVFNNAMLHELLCGHVTDYNNPHHTSAQQVLALQSVNNVGNGDKRSFVANIDLWSKDETIGVTPYVSDKNISLVLGAKAVRMSHVSGDVIENLVQSSSTITAEASSSGRRIKLSTNPAKTVTSVGGTKVVGASGNYAPEDHAHDLAEGVVERKHLNADVYKNLVQGEGVIQVTSNAAAHNIKITADTAPADDLKSVSSVTGTKRVGTSKKFAREDHAHDLYINGRPPNESGQFLLTPGANVKIENGAGANELVIRAEGGSRTVIATGFFDFEGVLPQEVHTSPWIPHGLNAQLVAVVLGEENSQSLRGGESLKFVSQQNATARFGDIAAFDPEAPFLMATADYVQKAVQIRLKDRRQPSRINTSATTASESELKFAPSGTFTPSGEIDLSREKEPLREIDVSREVSPTGIIIPSEESDPSGVSPGFIEPTGVKDPSGILIDTTPTTPDERTYRVRWWAITT